MSSVSISTIILPIYQAYAPKIAKIGGSFDLNVKDPSLSVRKPRTAEAAITSFLNFVLKNTKKPHIIIGSTDSYLIIKDENTLLDENYKLKYQNSDFKISVRLGFGSIVKIPVF